MQRAKEISLNSLLAAMVIGSIALSAQIWFPAGPSEAGQTGSPSVQVSPPSEQGVMPQVFRPERIYVKHRSGAVAMLQTGSTPYKQLWYGIQSVLQGMSAVGPASPFLEEGVDPQAEVLTLVMPLSLTVENWADQWDWNTAGLRNFSMKVDRVSLHLDQIAPMLHLSGSSVNTYRIGPLGQSDARMLRELIESLDPSLFQTYRPFGTDGAVVRVTPGLIVPDIADVPMGSLEVRKPDQKAEEARYFPDPTVVRQIDEKDARSYTDGQRLLRVTDWGALEYFSVNSGENAISPDLNRATGIASEWVSLHGGWPQDVVMGEYSHQPGRTSLVFDLRLAGAYPVESAGGALRLQVSTYRDAAGLQHSSVTQFRRSPDFVPYFGNARQQVISPEEAVRRVAGKYAAQLLFEEIREIHLAYLISLVGKQESDWTLEPVWVVQVGEERIYVPANARGQAEPFVARP
jgi:hypothetical protein